LAISLFFPITYEIKSRAELSFSLTIFKASDSPSAILMTEIFLP